MTGAPGALSIDFVVEAPVWDAQPSAEMVIRQALGAVVGIVGDRAPARSELALVLTDDTHIRQLNRQWRDRDSATNVLSFPAGAGGPAERAHIGDIVIAFETVAREAVEESKPFGHHLAHLAIHGFLHLLGYDHEDDDSATQMERTERLALAALGIPDPYRDEA